MPPKKPARKATPRPHRRTLPPPTEDTPEGGRTVMEKVAELPEPRVGRPNDKYLKLCEAVIGEFGAGVPVKLIEFSDQKSAYRAMSEITEGKRPVPGGPDRWEVRALVEEVDGQEAKGSALYVEWLGTE